MSADDLDDTDELMEDPLVKVSDVEKVLVESDLLPRHQIPKILQSLRALACGEVEDLTDELDDDLDFDDDPDMEW